MANQDARYFLNGMKFETEGNLLRTVATDGHRLAVCTIALEQELQNHAVILPRKGVLELSRLLETSDEPARLQIGTNNLRIHLNHIVFTSKLTVVFLITVAYYRAMRRKSSKAVGKH